MKFSSKHKGALLTVVIVFFIAVLVSTNFEPYKAGPVLSLSHRGLTPGASLQQVLAELGHASENRFDEDSEIRTLGWGEYGFPSVGVAGERYLFRTSCVFPAWPSESVGGFRLSQLSEPKAASQAWRYGTYQQPQDLALPPQI